VGVDVALGFGDNVDYEIAWDSGVIEDLVVRYGIREEELSTDRPVLTERDLTISVLSFAKAGSGGERVVSSTDVLETFSQRFPKEITLGGTAPRAALAMSKLGLPAALHLVTVNEHVRRLLPDGVRYVSSNASDTLYPHVIVQFAKGTTVRAGDIDIRARRGNRIIYHADVDNTTMNLNESFAQLCVEARALLISGFNAMRSPELLADRLASLNRITAALPEAATLFYEDAGYAEPTLRRMMLAFLAGRRHIVSMNEDELYEYVGTQVDLRNPSAVAGALASLGSRLPTSTIVVHTEQWAVAYGPDAGRFARALEGGTTMATARFRHGDALTTEHYAAVQALPRNVGGAAFARALHRLVGDRAHCVPVAEVDQSTGTTIGLGDAFVGGFLATLVTAP